MPLIWLRVAVAFYGVGLVYSILLLSKRGDLLAKVVEPAVGLGLIFHFVSLVESFTLSGHFSLASIHNSESILAFLAMVVFFVFFIGYRTVSPGVVIFPHCLSVHFRLGDWPEAGDPDLSLAAQRMGLRTCGADLHRLRRAVPEFRRQPAVHRAGAFA